jgi:hypothetical protein
MGAFHIKKFGEPARSFSFGKIPATKALRIEVKIAKLLGPIFMSIREGSAPTEINSKAKVTKAVKAASANDNATAEAVSRLLLGLDEDELLAVMTTVFEVVTCEGQPVDIDVTFHGKPKELWLVLWEGLRENFEDFFPENLSLLLKGMISK